MAFLEKKRGAKSAPFGGRLSRGKREGYIVAVIGVADVIVVDLIDHYVKAAVHGVEPCASKNRDALAIVFDVFHKVLLSGGGPVAGPCQFTRGARRSIPKLLHSF